MAGHSWYKDGTYYARNRDKALSKAKARYAAKKEEINRYTRGYYRAKKANRKYTAPWKALLYAAKYRARKGGMSFALNDAWATRVWTGRCALTGIEFDLPTTVDKRGPRFYSPSIDRVDPSRGYEPTNCRFVLSAVNSLKGTGSDADVFRVAKALISTAKSGSPAFC